MLPGGFYARSTLDVARDLIGKVLVHATRAGCAAGAIVEVEAYIGEGDPACHAAAGLTRRNAPLYGPPGRAYVYLNYGIHCLVNVVTEREGAPAAVLIRALEPRKGLALMRSRRQRGRRERERLAVIADEALCRGPGNLTSALAISRMQNRFDLSASRLTVEDWGERIMPIAWGPRIGIRVGADRLWRCYVPGSSCVSRSGSGRRMVLRRVDTTFR